MNIFPLGILRQLIFKTRMRFTGLLLFILITGSLAAQFPNPDAAVLFSRSSVSGTAASAGAGGAFSSVGGDLGSLSLNPAGLGLYKTSDICITPGLKISSDRSTYDANTMNAIQPGVNIAQAGAVLTRKLEKGPVKSFTLAINYQARNFFFRNQNFGAYNTTNSLIDNYVYVYNHGYTPAASLDAQLLNFVNILGYNTTTGAVSSNIKTPVQQSGFMNTRGSNSNVSLGFGANVWDKLYFGLSVAVPILNYTVNTQMSETNPLPTDSTNHFQYYTLNSGITESGFGFTGNVGLIYQPASWMRFGVSYGLPTWFFLNESANSTLAFSFDSTGYGVIPTQYNAPFTYRLRLPMKGVVGASFYFADKSFFSADYEFQNIGSTHYNITYDTVQLSSAYNNYMKSTYTYVHTLKSGIQYAYKKLRMRAGYSYISSPFKSGQNYMLQYGSQYKQYNESLQTATAGLGVVFKNFYIDLAYIFTYTKDGLSPNFQNFQVPLDEINSTYMTHSVLLTLGIKIPAKGGSNSSTKPKRRSSDQLPKNLDPDNKY
jgi:hypothetical protein